MNDEQFAQVMSIMQGWLTRQQELNKRMEEIQAALVICKATRDKELLTRIEEEFGLIKEESAKIEEKIVRVGDKLTLAILEERM